MDPLWSFSPAWRHALTLAERSAVLTGDHTSLSHENGDVELGRRRLEQWRSQPPFSIDPFFAQRLAQDGIDEERLLYLLSQPEESPHGHSPQLPDWLAELAEAFVHPVYAYDNPPPGEEVLGFLELIQPLVERACDRLAVHVAALMNTWPTLPFDPETIEAILLMNLPDPLLMRLERTMVLELNVARLQDQLDGDTPAERFQSFIQRLRQPEQAIAILAEYPVLARQLTICVSQWFEVCLEFLDRLCSDWEEIRDRFSLGDDPGLLVELAGGAGDTHRGGRSVMIATFDSGFRIVYKPKSLAIDVHFQELLTWLNHRGCQPPLRTLTVLDRETHGWVEYIEYQGCTSVDEIKRFYRRLGLYLALLYTLYASDFHLENLIAIGEHPLLIDLETLFNPRFEVYDETQVELVANRTMADSVLMVGMLPQRMWTDLEYSGIDISGLGGEEGQLSPDRLLQAADVGTDAMHFIRERIELPGEANRPRLDGVEANALDYVEDVTAGFVTMYELIMKHRGELLASDGPIARFAQDETRVLIRPTRTYDQLLFESFHPDMLRDGMERDLLLDRLWLVVPERTQMANVVPAEQADIRHGDIPVFTARPVSLVLWGANGEPIAGVLTETGMALVRRRLQQLDTQDMQRQVWFIRSSLSTLEPTTDGITRRRPTAPAYHLEKTATGLNRARLLAGAQTVADQLAATVVRGDIDVSWIGLAPVDEETWDLTPLGIDLYGGTPGIALFLAYAGAVFGEERYTELARRWLSATVRDMELFRPVISEIGAYVGWGGLLYTFTHLGVLWEHSATLSQAEDIVEIITELVAEDDSFDVVRGAAGAIGSLLAFYHCMPSDKVLNAAIACGDHLIKSAQPMAHGLGWVNPRFGPEPLAGFAHGAAGIAWALLELAAVTKQERFGVVARQAIDYERSLYSSEAENWPDLRQLEISSVETDPDSTRFVTAWCHGAVGIGLARLRALQHIDDPKLSDEVQIALRTTLDSGFGQTHSLCHGDMGNLDLLLEAGRVLNDRSWRVQTDRLASMILDSIERDGWQCGGPSAVEMPCLMLGIAGIGYEMLRLAEPDRIPSLLLLDPPVR